MGSLEGTYGLPDPNDEHVLAAAVVVGAGAIVTHNIGHFPQSKLPTGIEAITPAEFAANTVAILDILVNRYGMIRAVEIMRAAP